MTNRLEAGQPAPDFSLADVNGRIHSKEGLSGSRFILYFYPKAATPGCTKQACDFRDSLGALSSAGYRVLGVSPDDAEALTAFAAEESLTFPLLSDPDAAVARAYGAFGEKTVGGRLLEGTLRSTFVVDETGTLSSVEYDVAAEGHVARLRESLGV